MSSRRPAGLSGLGDLRVHNLSISLDGYAAGPTDGIEAALDRARVAAGDRHVRLGGGASTVRQYLRAGLVDDLHVAVVPVLLGGGERLFGDLGSTLDAYRCVEFAPSAAVAHVRLRR
jgi:dihydrofolate reductase